MNSLTRILDTPGFYKLFTDEEDHEFRYPGFNCR